MVSDATAPQPATRDGVRLPTRGELEQLPATVIHAGSATKSSVRVVATGGQRLLVKDVRPLHPLLRTIYGRRVLRREERALAALEGTAGVPRLLGRVDVDAIAMEYLDAEPLRRDLGRERLEAALAKLGERVDALHERGVVHLDLRQRRNVLVGPAGEVFLVDFQSALVLGRGGMGGVLLRWLARFDRGGVLKFKARYAPQLLTAAELRVARRQRWLGRLWIFHRFGPMLRWLFGRR
jgi:hypothetical protein